MDKELFYQNTNVLCNKLNIKDADKLAAAERDILAIKLYDVTVKKNKKNFDYEYLKKLHKFMYEDIYEWAGKERTFMIKPTPNKFIYETPSFSYPEIITPVAKSIFSDINNIDFKRMNTNERVDFLSKIMSDLWRVHPFVKGNTITIISFAEQYARYHGISFDYQTLVDHLPYIKKSLLRSVNGVYNETEYLNIMIKEAIQNGNGNNAIINPEKVEIEIIKAGYEPSVKLIDSILTLNKHLMKFHTVYDIKNLYISGTLGAIEKELVNKIATEFQTQEIRHKYDKQYYQRSAKNIIQPEL